MSREAVLDIFAVNDTDWGVVSFGEEQGEEGWDARRQTFRLWFVSDRIFGV